MNNFTFTYPTKVYFGKGAAENIKAELAKYGDTVMLAYGGGSIKKNGVYDEITAMLKEAGKITVEFSGIMPNPTYAKVQEGARSHVRTMSALSLRWAAALLSTATKLFPRRLSLTRIFGQWRTKRRKIRLSLSRSGRS